MKQYIHPILAVVLGVLIKVLLPAANGLTEIGVNVLAVLAMTVYLCIAVGTSWTSLLSIVLFVATGAVTAAEAFAGSMGHFSVTLTIACIALCECMCVTGVTRRVAVWFITRKAVQGRPYVFLTMLLLAFTVLGLFMETFALLLVFVPIVTAVLDDLGCEKQEKFYKSIMLGLLWMSAASMIATPISHPVIMIFVGYAEQLGYPISTAQWMAAGLPFAVVAFVLVMLVIRFVIRPDTTKFLRYDVTAVRQEPLSRQGKLTAVLFILVVVAWLLPTLVKNLLPGVAAFLLRMGDTAAPVLAVCLLCVLRVDGKPVVNFGEIAARIPMPVVLFTGCIALMGTVINLPSTGISVWVTWLLSPLAEHLSPLALLFVLTVLAMVMTNFCSNTVVTLLFYSIGIPTLMASDVNIYAAVFLLAVGGTIAYLTPPAAVMNSFLYGRGFLKVGESAGINILMCLLLTAAAIVLWPWFNFVL